MIGFHMLAATPRRHGRLTPAQHARVHAANAHVRVVAGPLGLTLEPGCEIAIESDMPARVEYGDLITLGDKNAILIELSSAGWPHGTDATRFALQTVEFQPASEHPERIIHRHSSYPRPSNQMVALPQVRY